MLERAIRRFVNGWRLGVDALSVVRVHPKLLVFPAASATALTALLGFFVYDIFQATQGVLGTMLTWGGLFGYGIALAYLFAFYVVVWFAMLFVATALTATVLLHQADGQMSVRAGFALAYRRSTAIFMWALFASTVGLLIGMLTRSLETWLGWFGQMIGKALGAAWGTAVYFVVPVIAVEGHGPMQSLRLSVETVRNQWGEAVGIEAATHWTLLPLHVFGVLAVFGAKSSDPTIAKASVVAAFAYVIVSAALSMLIRAIARCRLFIFAAYGELPDGADPAAYATVATYR